jgi:LPXTG-motif cell wall-anchored protein
MTMNDYDPIDDTFDDESDAPEESSNRTFLFVAGGLGVLILVVLLCVVGYVLFNFGSNQSAELTAQAQAQAQEATVQAALTQTAVVQAQTQAAEASATVPPTNTPVIAEATATETQNPATATVGAAFTQIAISTQTIIPTSTALPNTGFADEVGLPAMFGIALTLIAVIFLVRRLRAAPTR